MADAAKESAASLTQASKPAFAVLLGLLTGSEFGDHAALRARVGALFADIERQLRLAGIAAEDILSARFALTAHIDEAINRSDWRHKQIWGQNPLSLEYFNTNNAGVEFFDNLEALRQRPEARPDLLEIYYTCLALGFEGKYALTDPRQLQTLIESTARDLERVRGRASTLSPHGDPPDESLTRAARDLSLWIVAAIGAGVVFLTFLVFRFLAAGSAEDVAAGLRTLN
jgi:type VI secretion system protein ImpK